MITLLYLLLVVYLYILPGYALLDVLARPRRALHWGERVGIALALSLSIYPLLYVWAWWAGIPAGAWAVWGPGIVGILVLWERWRKRRAAPLLEGQRDTPGFAWASVALIGVVAAIGFSRAWAVRAMVAPAWGDSVHHAMIVQLMLEHGGLFQSWMPYAPLETFTYHAGFHVNLTVWAAATGLPADTALLWGGQLFNVFAVLVLFPLAYRLSGRNVWAGVLAVGVAGLVSSMPGYYTNWGRYTQLGAQIVLPALVWSFDRLWGRTSSSPVQSGVRSDLPGSGSRSEPGRDRNGLFPAALLTLLLAAGLVLTHYRVAMVGGAAGLAWAIWALWRQRQHVRAWWVQTAWAAGAAGGAGLLAAPWVLRLGQGHLTTVAGSMSAPADSQSAAQELVMWSTAPLYYPVWLMVLGGAALLLAVWRVPRLGVPLALWAALTFLAANPALVGVRGSGLISNFLLIIGLYVLFALPLGWLIAWACGQLMRRASGSKLVAAGLAGAIGLGGAWGAQHQAHIIDPANEMVAAQDLAVMAWIAEHTPPDARFLANGFLAYSELAVVGSDAGWWLPFYTGRAVNVLPITYTMETVAPQVDKEAMRQLVLGIQASGGDAAQLRAVLCEHDITHVYQGQRQATYAPPAERLVEEAWLVDNPDFRLLQRAGSAAVWAFERGVCGERGAGALNRLPVE